MRHRCRALARQHAGYAGSAVWTLTGISAPATARQQQCEFQQVRRERVGWAACRELWTGTRRPSRCWRPPLRCAPRASQSTWSACARLMRRVPCCFTSALASLCVTSSLMSTTTMSQLYIGFVSDYGMICTLLAAIRAQRKLSKWRVLT